MGLTQVSTDGVKNDAITKTKIPANQIEASELADNAVDTNAIANNAVTAGKLASGVQTTINNNADNRVITGSGTANTLNGESTLTFDGSSMVLGSNSSASAGATDLIIGANTSAHGLTIYSGYLDESTINFGDANGTGSTSRKGRIAYAHNGDKMIFTVNEAERLRIDSSGHLKFAGTTEEITLQTSDGSDNGYLNLSGGGACAQTRGAQLVLNGNERSGYLGTVQLMAGNAGSSSSIIQFFTGGSESMRLQVGGGISFNGDTAAANALDDYEEGTFTPSLPNGGGSVSVSATGKYHKIGGVVHVRLSLSNVQNHAVVDMLIGNLPFTSSSASRAVSNVLTNRPALTNGLCCFINDNESQIRIRSAFASDGQKGSIFNGYGLDFDMTYTVN